MTTAVMSNYSNGKSKFDDYMCAKVAEILNLDPLEVIANIQAEREKRPYAREYWEKLAHKLGKAAAVISAIALLSFFSFDENSTAYAADSSVAVIINIGLLILIWLYWRALTPRRLCPI